MVSAKGFRCEPDASTNTKIAHNEWRKLSNGEGKNKIFKEIEYLYEALPIDENVEFQPQLFGGFSA